MILTLKSRKDFPKLISVTHRSKFRATLNIAEIGVREGKFSEYLYTECIKNFKTVNAYAIDHWAAHHGYSQELMDNYYEWACNRLKSYDGIKIIRQDSQSASKLTFPEKFDFIYIDADHTYEAIKNDIISWYSHVEYGGILAGHDYDEQKWPGVVKAVKEFTNQYNLTIELTGHADESDDGMNSWYAIKRRKYDRP